MTSFPEGTHLFSEKHFDTEVLISLTLPTYQEAYRLGTNREFLSNKEISNRLKNSFSGNFKGYWLVNDEGELVSASWYQFVDDDFVINEKGEALSEFVTILRQVVQLPHLVWFTQTISKPRYWGQGLARKLKTIILEDLKSCSVMKGNLLALNCMRKDNMNIIYLNKSIGMHPTGVNGSCHADTKNPSNTSEYWYRVISPRS